MHFNIRKISSLLLILLLFACDDPGLKPASEMISGQVRFIGGIPDHVELCFVVVAWDRPPNDELNMNYLAGYFEVPLPLRGIRTDGLIQISIDDWDEVNLVGDDAADDSYWGAENDFDDIYVKWNSCSLFIGLEYTLSNNGIALYIDTGQDGGIIDFSSDRGYSGPFPRNITFPVDMGIDLMICSWNGESPRIYTFSDSGTAEIGSFCNSAISIEYIREIAIPWNEIYPDADSVVIPYAAMRIVGAIVGADDCGAGDAIPDNSSVDGGDGPHHLDQYIAMDVDNDGNGMPDLEDKIVPYQIELGPDTYNWMIVAAIGSADLDSLGERNIIGEYTTPGDTVPLPVELGAGDSLWIEITADLENADIP